jgi:AcrR family transcriptional regulator
MNEQLRGGTAAVAEMAAPADGAPRAGQNAPNAGQGAPSTGHGAPSTGHGAPSTGHGAPSTGHGAPSTGHGAPSTGQGAPGHDVHHEARRHDTRARIQRVAVELFAEQGYDKTSLREIAERLDVTKAALYYHFKSKEDIVRSLVEDYMGQVDALIAWAKMQPRTPETRGEILSRYVQIVADGSDVFRMLHHNQAAVNSLAGAKERGSVFRERMTGLVEAITEPEADLQERLRATMALGSVSIGWMFFSDQVKDRGELCAAVLDIARDLAKAAPETNPE